MLSDLSTRFPELEDVDPVERNSLYIPELTVGTGTLEIELRTSIRIAGAGVRDIMNSKVSLSITLNNSSELENWYSQFHC
jgi:hypothetical protein